MSKALRYYENFHRFAELASQRIHRILLRGPYFIGFKLAEREA